VLVAFNPFPDPAVLDVSFATDDGKRTPEAFQGRVVPPGHINILEVSDVVTVRDVVATDVRVRSGRVVVERLQVFDPDAGASVRSEAGTASTGTTAGAPRGTASGFTTPDDEEARAYSGAGTSVDLGTPVAAPSWVFPGSPARDPEVREEYLLYNPGKEAAQAVIGVTVEPEAGSLEQVPSVEPFTVTVRPEQYARVSLDGDDRIPTDRRHWDFVFTSNGVPIVAERYVRRRPDAAAPGIDLTIGSPLAAETWVAPAASAEGVTSSLLTVVNPSDDVSVTVSLTAVGGGIAADVAGATDVLIPAGQSHTFDLALLADAHELAAVLRATGPVVVSQQFTAERPPSAATSLAIPVAATMSRIRPPDLTTDGLVGGDIGSIPVGTVFTVPPGSLDLLPVEGGTTPGSGAGAESPPADVTTTVVPPVTTAAPTP
jgi:hypothetical protein